MITPPSHPALTLEDAKRFEDGLFGGDEAKEWPAMQRAGLAVGEAVLNDFCELCPFPATARLLVLVGKGHNGGDALLAAQTILSRCPEATADVWLLFGERPLRPLAARAYRELVQATPGRVRLVSRATELAKRYDVSLDGVFGFQFRPPLTPELAATFAQLNAHPIRFRAAVDLPSGFGAGGALRADFTYATGSVKTPVLDEANQSLVGRLRYLDLGFFEQGTGERTRPACGFGRPAQTTLPHCPRRDAENHTRGRVCSPDQAATSFAKAAELAPQSFLGFDRILTPAVLAPLRTLRPALSDKRTYGHAFILGGSRSYPGAPLMSVLAALRCGAGLVTAFVPESLAAAYAARVPEAMWVGWPETPAGGLALEGLHLLRERLARASCLLLGPGCSNEPETLALLADIAKLAAVPLVLDADALQPEVLRAGSAPRILTPHAGEFARIAGGKALLDFARETPAVTVLKGPLTRISDGAAVYHSCHGGPVLARGGSGDVLAGLIAGLLAQAPTALLMAACRGVVWQGRAADLLARAHGQVAVQTTQQLDFLATALREEST